MLARSTIIDGCVWVPTSGGTGSFVEFAALGGFQTMEAAGALDQQQFSYRAQSGDLSQWEIDIGIWTASTKTLTRIVLFNSLGTTSPINFTNPPQILITALANDFLPIPATSNLDFYVAPVSGGGSDTNPGTIGAPFLTHQHAVNVAAQYDYQNLYFPTIHTANGTYVFTSPLILPYLIRCTALHVGVIACNPGSPTSVVFDGTALQGNGWGTLFDTDPNAHWQVDGFRFNGSAALFRPSEGGKIICNNDVFCDDTTASGRMMFADPQNYASVHATFMTLTFQTATIQGIAQAQVYSEVSLFGSGINLQPNTHSASLFFLSNHSEVDCTNASFSGMTGLVDASAVEQCSWLILPSDIAGGRFLNGMSVDASSFVSVQDGYPLSGALQFIAFGPPTVGLNFDGGWLVYKDLAQPDGTGVQIVANNNGHLIPLSSIEYVAWHAGLGGI